MQDQPTNQDRAVASRSPMTLATFAGAARRRWWFGVVLVVGAVAMTLSFVSGSKHYESSTTLRLRTPGSLSDFVRTDSLDYLDRLANTYARLATSAGARNEVASRLGLAQQPAVIVRLRPNSELFEIRAASASPKTAVAIANTAAQVLLETVARQDESTLARANPALEKTAAELRAAITAAEQEIAALEPTKSEPASAARLAQLNDELLALRDAVARNESAYADWRAQLLDRTSLLSIVEPARVPASPQGLATKFAVVLAVLGALTVMVSVVLVGERLRRTVDTAGEAADAAGGPSAGLVTRSAMAGTQDAEFRHLRATVMGIIGQRTRGALLIADPARLEASHEVGLGLAAAIAEVNQSVAVVQLGPDSRLAPLVAAGKRPGLDDVLEGRSPLGDALVPAGRPGVHWLAGTGVQPIAPSLFGKVLADLLAVVDLVVVIGPPVRTSADTLTVAGEVGDVILVASLGSTRADDLHAAALELAAVGATVRATISVAPATRRLRRRWRSSRPTP